MFWRPVQLGTGLEVGGFTVGTAFFCGTQIGAGFAVAIARAVMEAAIDGWAMATDVGGPLEVETGGRNISHYWTLWLCEAERVSHYPVASPGFHCLYVTQPQQFAGWLSTQFVNVAGV